MKVWGKCNEVKGTDATLEQIKYWAYENRICPLSFDMALGIEVPMGDDGYPIDNGNGFIKTAHTVCSKQSCGMDCLSEYLESEFIEVEE